MASYESIYPGTQSSMQSDYESAVNYGGVSAGQLGAPLKADTAAQIIEASNMLNQGIKPIEIGVISPDVFDQIPKQHFKEINRLMKITGAKASLHAPLIEASGFSGEQQTWDQLGQDTAKNHLKEVIDKAHDLDPTGNTPVTMHSANMAGSQFIPGDVEKGEDRFKTNQLVAVDQTTGQVKNVFKEEIRYRLPDARSPESFKRGFEQKQTPEDMLETANHTQWISKIENLATNNKLADEVVNEALVPIEAMIRDASAGEKVELSVGLDNNISKAQIFLGNIEASFRTMFDEAYKYSGKEEQKALKQFADQWTEEQKKLAERLKRDYKDGGLPAAAELLRSKKELIDKSLIALSRFDGPEIFKPIEEFAMEKSADTFSDAAMHGYKKFGDSAPIVSIENMYSGFAYSKPKDFKKLINKTRGDFIKKAVKDGMSQSEAKKVATKLIGVTWDVGHLNLLRKQGFKEEDIVEATKLVGKNVKHVHLTDNFGYSDSHLPVGMGNVPVKKHLEALEKAGVDLQKMRFINESAGLPQHFGKSPHPYVLEAFGSPVFPGGTSWTQASGNFGGYLAGYGDVNPSIHHTIYGAGFTTLPMELGGNMPGTQSRFSDTPNA